MGLLDKLKNLFTDEEIIEEIKEIEEHEEKEIEKPKKLPTIMRNQITDDEDDDDIVIREVKSPKAKQEEISENKMLGDRASRFNFPIEFNDNDINDTISNSYTSVNSEKPVVPPVKEAYTPKKEIELVKKFSATPIISPVYGILDKNYKKEQVTQKSEEEYEIKRADRKVDYEEVRQRAFGSLTDDLKNSLNCDECEYKKEVIRKVREDDLLYDMTVDKPEEVRLEDFGVTYADDPKVTDTQPTKIELDLDLDIEVEIDDSVNLNGDVKIVNHNNSDVVADKIEVLEEPMSRSKKRPLELDIEEDNVPVNNDDVITDDLFNLIDSMYEDKED